MTPIRPRHLLVTGGAGFLGSAYVRTALAADPDRRVTVLDTLTHAGSLANLEDVPGRERLRFVAGDLADRRLVEHILAEGVDAVVNLATETGGDPATLDTGRLVHTDVHGIGALLEACRQVAVLRIVQVSTAEVYGAISAACLGEDASLRPRNPAAAAKAAGEHLVQSYFHTHGLPTLITRGVSTFGPHQHPAQLVPQAITAVLCGEPIPMRADCGLVHDWLAVDDHAQAIEAVLTRGTPGLIYNVGAGSQYADREVAERVLTLCGPSRAPITPVADWTGHGRLPTLDTSRLTGLGWQPRHDFESALAATVAWYREHEDWWRPLRKGAVARDHHPAPQSGESELEPIGAMGGAQ